MAASLTGGNGISTLAEVLENWLKELDVQPPDQDTIYSKLIDLAQEKLDTTLKVGVALWGERHKPEMTGCVANVTTDNVTLGDVSGGTMRGIVENLLDMMPEHVLQQFGVSVIGKEFVIISHNLYSLTTPPFSCKTSFNNPLPAY